MSEEWTNRGCATAIIVGVALILAALGALVIGLWKWVL